ncbi:MAG: shikimate kinase [Bacteroidota bacterium]|nr:shikimate kinase [Bacteroidota bacterium]
MRKVFLVGMPGSGKSRMAKFISSVTDLSYKDLDDEIERTEGKSIKEIFKNHGETYFRNKETKILKNIIEKDKNLIIATGGGTPCFNHNIDLINKSGLSIFLNTSLDVIVERISRKNKRPLFKNKDVEETVKKMFQERIKFYSKSRHHVTKNNRDKVLSIINSYT